MKNIFGLLFVFAWFQISAQMPTSEPTADFGINKLALTTNSSPVLETTLLDLDVTYDIALANQDYEAVSASLRQMGLAYYNFGYFNISKDYLWKAKIVAEKYGLKEQNLRCAAMLSKINLKLGNNRESIQFEDEYMQILSTIESAKGIVPTKQQGGNEVAFVPAIAEPEKAGFPLRVLFTALGLIGLLVLVNYLPNRLVPKEQTVEKKESVSEELFDIDINLESINLVDLTGDEMFEEFPLEPVQIKKEVEKQPEVKIEPIPVVQKQPEKPEEVQLEPEVIAEVEPQKEPVPETVVEEAPIEVQAEVKIDEPIVETPKEIEIKVETEVSATQSYHPKKAQPITAESVLAARGNLFYEKSETQKLPLWVSGIEHHFKNVNSTNGIRFDFNYTGDFSKINKEVHTVFTKFLRAIVDEFTESRNLQSVSAILVNSSIGLVIQMVARPIHPREPVLSLKSQNFYSQMVKQSNHCDVLFKESDSGTLKTVLKHVENKRELV